MKVESAFLGRLLSNMANVVVSRSRTHSLQHENILRVSNTLGDKAWLMMRSASD
jgi:hypothetical protein